MKRYLFFLIAAVIVIIPNSCKKDPALPLPVTPYEPSPYNLVIPQGFPDMEIPSDNPLTVEGIQLGRRLFYDTLLSGDFTQSCSSCHNQAVAFSDNGKQFSTGIDNIEGGVNAPTIINPGWMPSAFWDGRANSLEEQALGPVENPIEMHLDWPDAIDRLDAHELYPTLFSNVFGDKPIKKEMVAKAIAQFERTFISSESDWDKYLRGEYMLSQSEAKGFEVFFTEKGDCFHCHGTILFTDNLFHNNGLDSVLTNLGLGAITENSNDNGKFKSPTLRNIEFTAPYMHDGRFSTLEEVIDFYSEGVKFSSTVDPLMKKVNQGGLHLTESEKLDLIAFLKVLSDDDFLNNPDYSSPF